MVYMVVPQPLDYGKINICNDNFEECDKNQNCEFKEV